MCNAAENGVVGLVKSIKQTAQQVAADERAACFGGQGPRNVPEPMDVVHDAWCDTGNDAPEQSHPANWLIVNPEFKALFCWELVGHYL